MNALRRHVCLLTLCGVIAVTAACGGKKAPTAAPAPPPPPAAPSAPPAPPAPPPPPAPAPPSVTEEDLFSRKTLDQLNAERPLGDVYFDLDQAVIKDEGRAMLQRNADWMKRWSTTRVTTEGHCDSRGSSEYNLGLGERRAAAVKDYLVSLGIPGDRVTSVSKGKEQPVCTEETEACWAQNRRGHFIITAK